MGGHGMKVDWSRAFDEPIELPKGKTLTTLRDAALHITKLPKAEHDADEWQAAMEALLLVAELGGPTMFARIGMMRALNRNVERVFNPDRTRIGANAIEAGPVRHGPYENIPVPKLSCNLTPKIGVVPLS
jgi:hypothetical protein